MKPTAPYLFKYISNGYNYLKQPPVAHHFLIKKIKLKSMKKLIYYFAITLLLCTTLFVKETFAQSTNNAKWRFSSKQIENNKHLVTLEANLEKGWYIYSQELDKDVPARPTLITINPSPEYKVTMKPREKGNLINTYDKYIEKNVRKYTDRVTFEFEVQTNSTTTDPLIVGNITYMTCNDRKCNPPTSKEFKITLFTETTPKLAQTNNNNGYEISKSKTYAETQSPNIDKRYHQPNGSITLSANKKTTLKEAQIPTVSVKELINADKELTLESENDLMVGATLANFLFGSKKSKPKTQKNDNTATNSTPSPKNNTPKQKQILADNNSPENTPKNAETSIYNAVIGTFSDANAPLAEQYDEQTQALANQDNPDFSIDEKPVTSKHTTILKLFFLLIAVLSGSFLAYNNIRKH